MDLQTIKNDIEEIQLNIDRIGLKGQNEYDLHLRDDLAIYFRKEILHRDIYANELLLNNTKNSKERQNIINYVIDMKRELLKLEVPYNEDALRDYYISKHFSQY